MKKSVIVFEDNKKVEEELLLLFAQMEMEITFIFFDKLETATEYLRQHHVDLLVIDPKLDSDEGGESSGLYLARRIRFLEKHYITPIIFVSPKVRVEDLIGDISFCVYFEKYTGNMKLLTILKKILSENPKEKWVTFLIRGVLYNFKVEDIVYGEIYGRNFTLQLKEETVCIPYLSMKTFIEKVSDHSIYQCHRSYAVNLSYIAYINQNENKIMLMDSFGEIQIGRAFRKYILQKFKKEQ